MTFETARGISRILVQITPADPTAIGSYQMGGPPSQTNFPAANQLYAIKVSNQDGDADIDLQAGLFTTAGSAVFAGGDGKDPDGQVIDLEEIHAVQIVNTGASGDLDLSLTGWAPGTAPFSTVKIGPGGSHYLSSPEGFALTAGNLNIDSSSPTVAYEVIVLGKTGA